MKWQARIEGDSDTLLRSIENKENGRYHGKEIRRRKALQGVEKSGGLSCWNMELGKGVMG